MRARGELGGARCEVEDEGEARAKGEMSSGARHGARRREVEGEGEGEGRAERVAGDTARASRLLMACRRRGVEGEGEGEG